MATVTTGTVSIAGEVRSHFNGVLLHTAKPKLVHRRFSEKEDIPKGEGQTMQWRRWERLDPVITPLIEGVTPPNSSLVVTPITVTTAQYGTWIPISDIADVVSIDNPLVNKSTQMLGINAGETLDIVSRDVYNAGTTVRYANGRTSRATVTASDKLNDTEMKKIYRDLQTNLAPAFMMNGMEYYVMLVHPYVMFDIKETDGYTATGYYQDKQNIYMGGVRFLHGFMIVQSTLAKVFTGAGSGGINVYSTICFGSDALGEAKLASLGLETIIKPKSVAGGPLDQVATQGWKATHAAKIKNDSFIVRFESAASS